MRRLLLCCFFISLSTAHAQSKDTLKVVSYNLLNFPSTSPLRIDTLEVILQYLKPDILMVCELTSSAGAADILTNALNTGSITYAMAAFVDGPNTDNELFYNTDKLELLEQNEIATALRDINEYVLFHKAADIATTGDTVFFYIYVCHLKAGTGFESQRDDETNTLKDYIASRPNVENILIGGDFNFYGSDTEPAWNTMLSGAGVTIKDPIVSPGHWNSNSSFAPIHTQSTRTTSFDGGATGGMDDRFDIIFVGADVMNYSNDARYLIGTYRAVGQDALHYNDALIDPPTNTSEPWNVITALYNMSDHLPVYMEIEVISEFAGIEETGAERYFYYDAVNKRMINNAEGILFNIQILDLNGRIVKELDWRDKSSDLSDLERGIYILQATPNVMIQMKFVVE
ncbi:hypothetical protein JYT72_02195 [Crocinitomix catalasitica]|nr:hypothetical protein [Crocinitomix catalasitica]